MSITSAINDYHDPDRYLGQEDEDSVTLWETLLELRKYGTRRGRSGWEWVCLTGKHADLDGGQEDLRLTRVEEREIILCDRCGADTDWGIAPVGPLPEDQRPLCDTCADRLMNSDVPYTEPTDWKRRTRTQACVVVESTLLLTVAGTDVCLAGEDDWTEEEHEARLTAYLEVAQEIVCGSNLSGEWDGDSWWLTEKVETIVPIVYNEDEEEDYEATAQAVIDAHGPALEAAQEEVNLVNKYTNEAAGYGTEDDTEDMS